MLDRLWEALYNAFRGASRWQKMQAQSSKIAGDVESGTRARSLFPVKLRSCTLAAEGVHRSPMADGIIEDDD